MLKFLTREEKLIPHESHESKVFKALKRSGGYGLWNYELASLCIDWHRRIGDLRKDGVNIQHVRTLDGGHKYYLNKE